MQLRAELFLLLCMGRCLLPHQPTSLIVLLRQAEAVMTGPKFIIALDIPVPQTHSVRRSGFSCTAPPSSSGPHLLGRHRNTFYIPTDFRREAIRDMPLLFGEIAYRELGPTEIRLIDIQPGHWHDPLEAIVRVVNLRDNPLFEALSYRWKPTDGTIDTQHENNDKSLQNTSSPRTQSHIGANLASAIQHLRYESCIRTMWIDAVSINQEDTKERNQQVALMKSVYSTAKNVVIWLGPAGKHSNFCMDSMSTGVLDNADATKFCIALEELLKRDWFFRIWVVQELVLSRDDPIVHCGLRRLRWRQFAAAVNITCLQYRQAMMPELEKFYHISGPFLPGLSDNGPGFSRPSVTDQMQQLVVLQKSQNRSFSSRFLNTRFFQCEDPRDQVYGLLGICNFRETPITANYTKSVEQVFAEATAVIMQENFHLYVAMYAWGLDGTKSCLGPGAPTWASDLSRTSGSFSRKYRSVQTFRKSSPPREPSYRSAIEILRGFAGKAPIVDFSSDYSIMRTVGHHLGKVEQHIHIDVSPQIKKTALLASWRKTVTVLNKHGSYDFTESLVKVLLIQTESRLERTIAEHNRLQCAVVDYLRLLSPEGTALAGPNDNKSTAEDAFGNGGRAKETGEQTVCSYTDRRPLVSPPSLPEEFESLLDFGPSHAFSVFITNTGVLGITTPCDENKLVQDTTKIIGIFGINMTFLLQHLGGDEYQIMAPCYLAAHSWGHNFIQSADPGTGYETFLFDGRLERINIH